MNGVLFKKYGVVFLTVVLLLTSLVPVQAETQYEKGLEDAIIRAKTLFDIQDSYDTFNYSIQNQNGVESYNMNWTDSKNKKGNISVNILATGEVTSYHSYKPYTGEQKPRIPAISKSEAIKAADEFIAKINPGWISQLKLADSQEPYGINNGQYYLRYTRIYNGIIFPENTVNISVDNQTGNILNFYSSWSTSVEFPDASGVIPIEKAQQAYKDKIGLSLMYRSTYKDNETEVYLAYGSVYNNRTIDAVTGEMFENNPYMYGYGGSSDMRMEKSMAAKSAAPVLTPSEKDAVDKIGKIITAEKAEETARSIVGIGEDYTLENKNLINDWQNRDEFMWSMNFTKKSEIEKYGYFNTSVSLDAKTGELLNFYKSMAYDKEAEVTIDKEKAVQLAEDFLRYVQYQKFGKVERTDWNESIVRPLSQEDKPRSYSFTFTRKENGAYFPGNGFNISVDSASGSIISYNCNWYRKELPATEGIISMDEAYESLFDNIGLQLQYVTYYSNEESVKGKILPPRPNVKGKPELKLVYAINQEKPLNIDPFTGKVLNYDSTEYKDKTEAGQYTDIAGHEAEGQIKVLAEYGIALPGTEFKPDRNVTQKEFLFLLMKTLNSYIKADFEDPKAEEEIYNYCIMSSIIKEGEKSPEANISVQEAARFVVRGQHYDKVAEMKGIFALPFKDAGDIQPGMEGYIAIAYGMSAIKDNDGYIYPNNNVTRANTIQMIYNYLTTQK